MGFSEKTLFFFSKSITVVNLQLIAYQMVLFRENVFSALILRFFGKKSENFEVAEIRK